MHYWTVLTCNKAQNCTDSVQNYAIFMRALMDQHINTKKDLKNII